jgi:hypothetical protein
LFHDPHKARPLTLLTTSRTHTHTHTRTHTHTYTYTRGGPAREVRSALYGEGSRVYPPTQIARHPSDPRARWPRIRTTWLYTGARDKGLSEICFAQPRCVCVCVTFKPTRLNRELSDPVVLVDPLKASQLKYMGF